MQRKLLDDIEYENIPAALDVEEKMHVPASPSISKEALVALLDACKGYEGKFATRKGLLSNQMLGIKRLEDKCKQINELVDQCKKLLASLDLKTVMQQLNTVQDIKEKQEKNFREKLSEAMTELDRILLDQVNMIVNMVKENDSPLKEEFQLKNVSDYETKEQKLELAKSLLQYICNSISYYFRDIWNNYESEKRTCIETVGFIVNDLEVEVTNFLTSLDTTLIDLKEKTKIAETTRKIEAVEPTQNALNACKKLNLDIVIFYKERYVPYIVGVCCMIISELTKETKKIHHEEEIWVLKAKSYEEMTNYVKQTVSSISNVVKPLEPKILQGMGKVDAYFQKICEKYFQYKILPYVEDTSQVPRVAIFKSSEQEKKIMGMIREEGKNLADYLQVILAEIEMFMVSFKDDIERDNIHALAVSIYMQEEEKKLSTLKNKFEKVIQLLEKNKVFLLFEKIKSYMKLVLFVKNSNEKVKEYYKLDYTHFRAGYLKLQQFNSYLKSKSTAMYMKSVIRFLDGFLDALKPDIHNTAEFCTGFLFALYENITDDSVPQGYCSRLIGGLKF